MILGIKRFTNKFEYNFKKYNLDNWDKYAKNKCNENIDGKKIN